MGVIGFIVGGSFLFFNKDKSHISYVLAKSDYAYLPKEAQEYIKDIYNTTGEVVLTEKNKKENQPYLNPEYAEYLHLKEKDKTKVSLIPDPYIIDYSTNESFNDAELPSSFDLRNQSGFNFVSPIKNQGSTNICWAFASIENIETLYMKNNNQSYSDLVPKFSVRQMDYATSTNRFIKSYTDSGTISCKPVESCTYYPWENPDNGSREAGAGGNFFTSSVIMANGLTLTDESVLPWNEEFHTFWPKDILSYDTSLYEVNSTVQMPTINADTASEDVINSYVNDVKNYMVKYGGPFIGTYSPTSTCGFNNTDGTKAMKTDDCVNNTKNKNQGHAMQIIGWDDNYEYSYCDSGTIHSEVKNGSCSTGTLVQGKGAWILKNSWGEDSENGKAYRYVYLTYDSTRLSIGFTTSMSEMANRTWDNNYHSNPWIESNISNGMANVSEQVKEFNTHNNKSEILKKIKFFTASKNGKYSVSIIVNGKEYNDVAVVNSGEVGIYTLDLSDKNILLDNNIFSVKIVGENDSQFYNDSISVFTSNVVKDPYLVTYNGNTILSQDNPLVIDISTKKERNFTIYQKNLPSNSVVDFRVVRMGEETTSDKKVASDVRREIYNDKQEFKYKINTSYYEMDSYYKGSEGPFVFQLLVDNKVVDSFPIVRTNMSVDKKSNVKLYANNGTDYYESLDAQNEKQHSFNSESLNNSKFFNQYHYLVGWNTKADGTGTSYPVDNKFWIVQDRELYAQWSDDTIGSVNIEFVCQKDSSCYDITGTVASQTLQFDEKIVMPNNNYVKNGYKFSKWRLIHDNGTYYTDLYEGQTTYYKTSYYMKYPVYKNSTIRVYATWVKDSNAIKISFDANGGTGNMKPIYVEKAYPNGELKENKIKENMFVKNGYKFIGWNTEADGTGTSYSDKGGIKSDFDVKLYAQWEEIGSSITFDANGGTVSIDSMKIPDDGYYGELPIPYKENAGFVNWSCKSDGTRVTYNSKVSCTELVATWVNNAYTFILDANGGTLGAPFDENNSNLRINSRTNLSTFFLNDGRYPLNENMFVKNDKVFKEWNTKADGSGKIYLEGQYVGKDDVVLENNTFKLYAIWEDYFDYRIKDYYVDETNHYISKIMAGTSGEDFKKKIEHSERYGVEVDTKNIDGKEVMYTGGKTRIYQGGNVYVTYTNIVIGDVNGDGAINSADLLRIRQHLLGNKSLSGENFLASDINYDSDINSADILRVRQHLLGTKTIS